MLLYKQTNKHSPLYGCSEWFVRYPLLWQSRTNVRVLLVREGVVVRAHSALPSVCMGCTIMPSVVRTRTVSVLLHSVYCVCTPCAVFWYGQPGRCTYPVFGLVRCTCSATYTDMMHRSCDGLKLYVVGCLYPICTGAIVRLPVYRATAKWNGNLC